ncbi:hypothetical protein BC829DRAFT_34571 [Chytridium lagenaria]|nr:hypothetical protein BC829DRAFT_34571 [Chytridium lagenaria]
MIRGSAPRDRPLSRNILGSRYDATSYSSRAGLQMPLSSTVGEAATPVTPASLRRPIPTTADDNVADVEAKPRDIFLEFIPDTQHSLLNPHLCHIYDRFILIYTDYLFDAGLLEQRTHMLKSLYIWRLGFKPDTPTSIEADISCACGKTRDSLNTGVRCKKCNKTPKQRVVCTVCNLPCKNLVTLCVNCGHGGHVDHLAKWFSSSDNNVCPSGCGCTCLFSEDPAIPE